MPVIAITGGLGSGKSTVRKIFEELGAAGVDTDELSRQVVAPGTTGASMVREAFGGGFFTPGGHLDRRKMADHVFSDPAALKKLESILHPLIREREASIVKDCLEGDPGTLVVVEIPLLAEGGRSKSYDGVVMVTAPVSVRMERLVTSGRYTPDEALSRISSQAGDPDREKIASWVIDNGGTMGKTRDQVRSIMEELAGNS